MTHITCVICFEATWCGFWHMNNATHWNMASFSCGPTLAWWALKQSMLLKHEMLWGCPNMGFDAWVMWTLKHSAHWNMSSFGSYVLIPCPHGPCAPSKPHPCLNQLITPSIALYTFSHFYMHHVSFIGLFYQDHEWK